MKTIEIQVEGKTIQEKVDRKDFFSWLDKNQRFVEFIFHIGARTDTTEFDVDIFNELNPGLAPFINWDDRNGYGLVQPVCPNNHQLERLPRFPLESFDRE